MDFETPRFQSPIGSSEKDEGVLPVENINASERKPDVSISDLEEALEEFPEPEKSLSLGAIENISNVAKELNKRIEVANGEIREIFPKFREILGSLENQDYKVNNIYAAKLETLSAQCGLIIDKFIRLGGNKNLFVNQIGILTIVERYSKFFAEIRGRSSAEDSDKAEETGDKLLGNMDALEKLVQNF